MACIVRSIEGPVGNMVMTAAHPECECQRRRMTRMRALIEKEEGVEGEDLMVRAGWRRHWLSSVGEVVNDNAKAWEGVCDRVGCDCEDECGVVRTC